MQSIWVRTMMLIAGALSMSLLEPRFSFAKFEPSSKADYIVIEKERRVMRLLQNGQPFRTYHIALGKNPIGPKVEEGDKRTPEGKYFIDFKKRQSQFHLALHISYPNRKDKLRAKKLGLQPGGDILIHGLKKGWEWVGNHHTTWNWTAGCIAVTNPEIEEIWKLVQSGTVVEIRP